VDRHGLPPIIVLTSSDRDEDVLQAYELGAQSYICKPMSYPEFADTVCDTLEYWLGLNRPVPRREGALAPPEAGWRSGPPEIAGDP
jgi:response regulator RpfG family c-di-GMP phosphodiesterase